jgi:hypothetical protein
MGTFLCERTTRLLIRAIGSRADSERPWPFDASARATGVREVR